MIKELSQEELSLVSGGIAPLIPVAVAVGSRFVTNQLAKHYISNGSLIYGTYKASEKMAENSKK